MHGVMVSRRARRGFAAVVAFGGLLLGVSAHSFTAQAITVAPPALSPADYIYQYGVYVDNAHRIDQDTTHSATPYSGTQSLTSPYNGATGTFNLDVVGKPLPGVTVSANSAYGVSAGAFGEVTYQFMILPVSTAAADGAVDVNIHFKGSQSVSPIDRNLYSQTIIAVKIDSYGDYRETYTSEEGYYNSAAHNLDGSAVYDIDDQATSFDVTNLRTLHAGVVYTVDLQAQANAAQTGGEVSASIDPYIMITGDYSRDYRLVFSEGIGNFAVAPLPATLPLFVSAIGGLGILGWRRKQRPAAA